MVFRSSESAQSHSHSIIEQSDLPNAETLEYDEEVLDVEMDEDYQDEDLPFLEDPHNLGTLFDDDHDDDTSYISGDEEEDLSGDDQDDQDDDWDPEPIEDIGSGNEPDILPPNLPDTPASSIPLGAGRQTIENQLRQPITVEKFSDRYADSNAGKPIVDHSITPSLFAGYTSGPQNSSANPYAPFRDKLNWDIARWAKLRGPGSTALSELLSIPGVSYI